MEPIATAPFLSPCKSGQGRYRREQQRTYAPVNMLRRADRAQITDTAI